MVRCTTARHVQLRRYSTETHATFRVHSVTNRPPLTMYTGVRSTDLGVTTSFANVCESITCPTHSCNLLFCRFYQHSNVAGYMYTCNLLAKVLLMKYVCWRGVDIMRDTTVYKNY